MWHPAHLCMVIGDSVGVGWPQARAEGLGCWCYRSGAGLGTRVSWSRDDPAFLNGRLLEARLSGSVSQSSATLHASKPPSCLRVVHVYIHPFGVHVYILPGSIRMLMITLILSGKDVSRTPIQRIGRRSLHLQLQQPFDDAFITLTWIGLRDTLHHAPVLLILTPNLTVLAMAHSFSFVLLRLFEIASLVS